MSSRSGMSKGASQPALKRKGKNSTQQLSPSSKQDPMQLSSTQPLPDSDPAESDPKLPESADGDTQNKAKDTLIEELNRRIVHLSAQAKRLDIDSAAAKEKQLKALLEDKAALLKQLKGTDATIAELQEKLQTAAQKQEEEKQMQESLIEAMTEETEKLKARLGEKLEQNSSTRADITNMSKIVQDMTALNTELNEKILRMNQDMEESNKAVFEATAKSSQTEDLERELIGEKTRTQKLEAEVKLLKEDLERSEGQLKHASGVIATVCHDLSSVENEQCRKAVEALSGVSTFTFAPKAADTVSNLSFKVQQLKAELKSEKKESARVSKIDSLQRSRITALEGEKNKIKTELSYVIEKQKKQLAVLKEWMKTAVEKTHEIEERLESTAADLQQSQTSVLHLTAKLSHTKDQLAEAKKNEEALKLTVKNLKNALLEAQSDRTAFESALLTRESKAKDAIAKLEAFNEELWRRDNEIIRKEGQRLKVQDELNNFKAALQSSHVQYKIRMSEEMSKANMKLEGREQEINELKRMLIQGQSTSAKKAARSNQQMLTRLEDALKQLRILKDRTKSGPGDDSERQLAETLKSRCNAVISTLEKELQSVLSTPLTTEDTASFPNLKDIVSAKEGQTASVQEVIADMKNYINQA